MVENALNQTFVAAKVDSLVLHASWILMNARRKNLVIRCASTLKDPTTAPAVRDSFFSQIDRAVKK